MAGTGDMAFTFQPQGNQTLVTWSMDGDNGYIGKLMGLFMSMDKMIGGAFERGLVEIKTVVEAEAKH
jgi:carbon monoxide dehydrogenase subunit G